MNTQLGTLVANQTLINFNADETVESALDQLFKYRITAAPVQGEKKFIGLIDVLDLLSFLVKTSTKSLTNDFRGESRKLLTDDMCMLRKRSRDFNLTKVQEVIDFSNKNPSVVLYTDQKVEETFEPFSKGIHRVMIANRDSNQVIGLLSQTDVVGFLANWEKNEFDQPISQLKNQTEKLVTVPPENWAFDSFMTMYNNGLSSVGILNHMDQLVGNLSAADLKPCSRDFTLLLRSTIDYVKQIRESEGRPMEFLVCCSPETTLRQAVDLMAKERVHRIYTIDSNRRPIAVISFTDILREVYMSHN